MSAYNVRLTWSAQTTLDNIASKKDVERLLIRLDALKIFPYMGTSYNPMYPSSMPPHELKVTYVSHYGIYYSIVENDKLVYVEYIEDSYKNPFNKFRFTEIPPSEA